MVIKCPVCEAHIPATAAVAIPIGGEDARFCSLRCAMIAEKDAKQEAPVAKLPEAPKRLLVAVDGSGPSLHAVEMAVSIARLAGGTVTLLHAIDPALLRLLPVDGVLARATHLGMKTEALEAELRKDAEAQLERCQRVCREAGVEHSVRIELEAPSRAIAAAAEAADLVVMGSRGLGALSGAALGSLSHRVIGDTAKPVLIVH